MEKKEKVLEQTVALDDSATVDLLTEKINQLSRRYEELEDDYNKIKDEVKKMYDYVVRSEKALRKIEFHSREWDLPKRYGFDRENMYYIGAGSGRIYVKPINAEMVEIINKLSSLDWKEVQRLNQHFMKH